MPLSSTETTRHLFFTGKGGVGKTTVACATAVRLADAGRKVLLVSTDPASNLDEVLGVSLGQHPTQVDAVPGLWGMNIDPQAAAAEYRERMVGPYRGLLPAEAITSIEEQFSGSCTLEIAAFDEFARLLGDPEATQSFDHVIFDTAPTGHTLRLLTLPTAWSGYLDQNTTGTSCLGPLAGLRAQQEVYRETVRRLSDPSSTTVLLVSRPEPAALREASRTSDELAALGVRNQRLVLNGIFHASDPSDPIALAMDSRGQRAIADAPPSLRELPTTEYPLDAAGVLGIQRLRDFGQPASQDPASGRPASQQPTAERPTSDLGDSQTADPIRATQSLESLVDALAASGHGVVLTMGKGGVGKTTVAAAIAVALANRGLKVTLTTTDPAAHVTGMVDETSLPNLSVSRIDPIAETARYASEVYSTAGEQLDAAARALLEEDLRSPCTEEIAVFRAFADAVAQGLNRFVVLDTAPTGHTILLLDAALAYHREVLRQSSQMPIAVQELLPRLRDPRQTHVLIVTLPEATPVHEAAALQADLRRAAIEPRAWVINQSLTPLSPKDPTLVRRRDHERKYIAEVIGQHAKTTILIAWQADPPVGTQALLRLADVEADRPIDR